MSSEDEKGRAGSDNAPSLENGKHLGSPKGDTLTVEDEIRAFGRGDVSWTTAEERALVWRLGELTPDRVSTSANIDINFKDLRIIPLVTLLYLSNFIE